MDEESFYEDEWRRGIDDGLTEWRDDGGEFPERWRIPESTPESDVPTLDADTGLDDDVPTRAARSAFGVRFLFPWQRGVVENVLAGARGDAAFSRQVVILPTGAGKSLCFLVPALLLPRPTLVVYPLLSLMADQRRRMDAAGIGSATFRGGQTRREREECLSRLRDGRAKVALANPEVLRDPRLLDELRGIGLSHVAVDEAHCVAEWGDTFRPAYLELGRVVERLAPPAVTAFTATASGAVLSRLGGVLFPRGFRLVRGGSDRANIRYSVVPALAKMHAALVLARSMRRPMLIFCATRARAESMGRLCAEAFGATRARFYHAGMSKAEKEEVEGWFFSSGDGILAATCAYGMGVDKPDIRTVVHLDASGSVEAFCQESGRAGRDGGGAESVLLWSRADSAAFGRGDGRAREMAAYAEGEGCRRAFLLSALGDPDAGSTACSGCDVCGGKSPRPSAEEEEIVGFARRNRRLYPRAGAERILTGRLSRMSVRSLGFCAWEESDTADAMSQLLAARRIRLVRGRLCPPRTRRPPRAAVLAALTLRRLLRPLLERLRPPRAAARTTSWP